MADTRVTTLADGIAALRTQNGEAPDAKQVRALAMQFESLLIGTMLKEMRDSADTGTKEGAESAPLFGSLDTELALALSRAGGMGMADSLVEAFKRQTLPGVAPAMADATAMTAPRAMPIAQGMPAMLATPAAIDAQSAVTDLSKAIADASEYSAPTGRVSSAFGWRRDPVKGDLGFHHGTDIAMPVGQEVPVAAAGRVTFAGEQGGYGKTVVVQHPDGLETRYAHLSALLVNAGDTVTKGQSVAKSGNTGKSTGPHLHFEVRRNGQSMDPAGLQ